MGFSPNSHFAYVQALGALPARVDRVEIATDRRTKWRSFQPANLSGVMGLSPIVFSTDLKAYAYNYEGIVSDLYTLDGVT